MPIYTAVREVRHTINFTIFLIRSKFFTCSPFLWRVSFISLCKACSSLYDLDLIIYPKGPNSFKTLQLCISYSCCLFCLQYVFLIFKSISEKHFFWLNKGAYLVVSLPFALLLPLVIYLLLSPPNMQIIGGQSLYLCSFGSQCLWVGIQKINFE